MEKIPTVGCFMGLSCHSGSHKRALSVVICMSDLPLLCYIDRTIGLPFWYFIVIYLSRTRLQFSKASNDKFTTIRLG